MSQLKYKIKSHFARKIEKINNYRSYEKRRILTARLIKKNQLAFQPISKEQHIIFIVIDALRYDHLSVNGYKRETTPFLHSVAEKAALFRQCHSASCWTVPAVASLLSGKYPYNHDARLHNRGIKNIDAKMQPSKMKPNILILPEILNYYGFDLYLKGSITYVEPVLQERVKNYEFRKRESAEKLIKAFKRKIKKIKPLSFYYLHLGDVHQPISLPDKYYQIFGDIREMKNFKGWANALKPDHKKFSLFKDKCIRLYDAAIRYVDKQLEDLWNTLERKKLLELSTIIITADHGEQLWDHMELDDLFVDSSSWPYLGHGQNHFQELIHVPLMIFSPFINPGIYNEPVSHVDIFPTILKEIGITGNIDTDGINLTGGIPSERPIHAQDTSRGYEKLAVRYGKYKLIKSEGDKQKLLFDLVKDPKEKKSIENYEMQEQLNEMLPEDKKEHSQIIDTDPELIERLRALGYIE